MTLSNINTRRVAEGKRAFTLIELIVVIVIIGILAAVAAVSYNSFIAGANESASESTANQVSKVIQAEAALKQAPYGDFALQYDATTNPVGANPGTPAAAGIGTGVYVATDSGTGVTTKAINGWIDDVPSDVEAVSLATTSNNTTLTVADGDFTCTVVFDATGVGTSPQAAASCL